MDDRLRQLRLEKGLTQREVAEALGISARAYSYYEVGSREPPLDILKQFCKFFDVSADYLLGLSDY